MKIPVTRPVTARRSGGGRTASSTQGTKLKEPAPATKAAIATTCTGNAAACRKVKVHIVADIGVVQGHESRAVVASGPDIRVRGNGETPEEPERHHTVAEVRHKFRAVECAPDATPLIVPADVLTMASAAPDGLGFNP
ncbi:hypothetical protein [Fluviibacterium sp. S390]|uniref:hypothetical protein n=1 Tax=Fluviibacterium sp. S390 TaxID=3415139 RepID=UPI003C7B5E8B